MQAGTFDSVSVLHGLLLSRCSNDLRIGFAAVATHANVTRNATYYQHQTINLSCFRGWS